MVVHTWVIEEYRDNALPIFTNEVPNDVSLVHKSSLSLCLFN